MDQRSTILLLRIIACVVIAAALGAFVVQLKLIPELTALSVTQPAAQLVFGGGLGALLFGIGAVLKQQQKPAEISPIDLAQRQLIDLAMKMEDLGTSINRLAGLPREPASTATGPHVLAPDRGMPEVLPAMQKMFDELREQSILPEEERQKQWRRLQNKRREMAIQTVANLTQQQQWAEAQEAVGELESQWPGDPAVAGIRKEFDAARRVAENQAIELAESQIRSEMSASHWNVAATLVRKLAADHPTNARVSQLLSEVEQEHAIYNDKTVGHLYEEIRRDVERRIWRRAHFHAQRLLQQFPEHPRSELVRKQIQTIQDNAEIEERQEQEMRIGELIRARRFAEAVELSEGLLRSYPTSPQAEAIQKLLPRIQELAFEARSEPAQTAPP